VELVFEMGLFTCGEENGWCGVADDVAVQPHEHQAATSKNLTPSSNIAKEQQGTAHSPIC
jgi:hypothetical protein